MEQTVQCPSCGGRATLEPHDMEPQAEVLCPWCGQQIPLSRGAEAEPAQPAD